MRSLFRIEVLNRVAQRCSRHRRRISIQKVEQFLTIFFPRFPYPTSDGFLN
jgi:hypothetical protein